MELKEDHRVIRITLEAQPNLGEGDESKCLPAWLNTFCKKWEEGGEMTLSHNAVGNLLHTLIAARERARRLVRERDDARKAVDEKRR